MSTGNITVNTNTCNVPSVRWNVKPDLERARAVWYTDLDNKTLVVVHGLDKTYAVVVTGELWINLLDEDGHVVVGIRDKDALYQYGITNDSNLDSIEDVWQCYFVLDPPVFSIVDVTGDRATFATSTDIFDAVQLAIVRAGGN